MGHSEFNGEIIGKIRVQNTNGLHTRPSSMIFEFAQGYPDRIYLIHGNQRADAKKMLDLLMLGAFFDAELSVEVEGQNGIQIFEGLQNLFNNKFGEK